MNNGTHDDGRRGKREGAGPRQPSGGAAGGRSSSGGGRRNEQGRERNRGTRAPRQYSEATPAQRLREADPARLVAFEVLRAVSADNAYANLVLPAAIRRAGLDRRDAGLATELSYGALRGQGTYDAIISRCMDRTLAEVEPAVLDVIRLGAHQLLATRIPPHAAVNQTVGLARAVVGAGAASFVNAILRRISEHDLAAWLELLTDGADPLEAAAVRYAHPAWIVRALRQSLVSHGRPVEEIDALLEADNAAPVVNLVALPGLGSLDEALDAGFEPGPLVEDSAIGSGGDPGRMADVRSGRVRVQDVGSQLVSRALAGVPLQTEEGTPERWLDLCAGPGGKAALLAALAHESGASLLANEPTPHRAELVRKALLAVPEETWQLRQGDGRTIGEESPERFHRILVDAPCSGLGALRRRPEARWRRTPAEVAQLSILQRELLSAGLDALAPGGVLAYVTCSPHPAETSAVVADVLRKRQDIVALDAGSALDAVALRPLEAGHDQQAQLWPHLHGTDAMFLALLQKKT
ncbi:RsmB/NOP family class I SAM-dependent RNA methyltransferase [Psychromicrobium xiongbiense]|uniref:RsmB/NOP family class I SAM-dependent RNA methyltransferase n=1 Tax=Psychromicrobium xiongbiense TaxID=3051184 RepID=UPI002552A606|nr:transcription antitermination factor NusB [Psychromicrobium sp. YIM S02556]